MQADLTISSLSFKQAFSDETGSKRNETSRGANLPEIMLVKHQDITDSATKLPARRSLLRFDRSVTLTGGTIAPVSAYVVVQVPKDSAVQTSDIQAVVARILGVLSATSNPPVGLGLGDSIFVNAEQ